MNISATGKRRFNQLICTNLATPSGFSWNQPEPRNSNSPRIFRTDLVFSEVSSRKLYKFILFKRAKLDEINQWANYILLLYFQEQDVKIQGWSSTFRLLMIIYLVWDEVTWGYSICVASSEYPPDCIVPLFILFCRTSVLTGGVPTWRPGATGPGLPAAAKKGHKLVGHRKKASNKNRTTRGAVHWTWAPLGTRPGLSCPFQAKSRVQFPRCEASPLPHTLWILQPPKLCCRIQLAEVRPQNATDEILI